MAYADTTRVEAHIADILNANGGVWGGAIIDKRRGLTVDSIRAARIESGMEILRAIASNPKNGCHGLLATLITVAHGDFLPAHNGEIGIPLIVPYSGAPPQAGIPAEPDQIDSFRFSSALSLIYSGNLDGLAVEHNVPDSSGIQSPLACFYSIVGQLFKFTGYSAQIPLIQLTRAMADTGVPETFEPTLVKLSIPKLVKEGDNLAQIASAYGQMGMNDLALIADGAPVVSPIPDVESAQKARAA